jgi:type IV pilus assembly protein PilB
MADDPFPLEQLSPDVLLAEVRGARALARRHSVPLIDLRSILIDRKALESIPLHILVRVGALPYELTDGRLKIAVADPGEIQLMDELRQASAHPVDFAVATADEIDFHLQKLQRGNALSARAALGEDELPLYDDDTTDLEAEDGISDASPIRLVNSIVLQAAEDNASDVHFVPRRGGMLLVRVRVDGVVHEVEQIPTQLAAGVISRLKVLAKLDIAEHRKPQDGRISLKAAAAGRLLDLRVTVLPTVEGEGVLVRLLDKSRSAPTLTEIGLSNELQMALEQVIHRPTGSLLVTGPTGSGKSTTVYAALADISRPEINIVTVEDPVEYRLTDVFQLQLSERAGLTFTSALRAILRSDPDVIMVGEIRDTDTAKLSLEASLTGHFVLSTMHTNDAPSALARLTDMGVEPFVTAAGVTAVLAQRLVRRLCTHCRESYTPTPDELRTYGFPTDSPITLYRPRGCRACSKGYRGRIGIHQLMVMTTELKQLTAARASADALQEAAMRSGMKTLWADGLAKAAAGLTGIDELYRLLSER